MAISVDIVEARGQGRHPKVPAPVLELPAVRVQHITAAGTSAALAEGSLCYELINNGDAVWFRLRGVDDATEAGAADDQSIQLAAGSAYGFMLPDDADPTEYEIDIRAI